MKKRQMSCEQALNMMGPSGYRDPLKSPGPGRFPPVWLKREGEYVTVSLEIDGQWCEVIREYAGSPFSHIWEGRQIPETTGDR